MYKQTSRPKSYAGTFIKNETFNSIFITYCNVFNSILYHPMLMKVIKKRREATLSQYPCENHHLFDSRKSVLVFVHHQLLQFFLRASIFLQVYFLFIIIRVLVFDALVCFYPIMYLQFYLKESHFGVGVLYRRLFLLHLKTIYLRVAHNKKYSEASKFLLSYGSLLHVFGSRSFKHHTHELLNN